MSTKFFILAAGALAVLSCAKVEPCAPGITEEQTINSDVINIRIVNEGDDTTKAYYYETPSYWTYNWEDKDNFRYFYYSRAELLGSRSTSALKTPDATFISYEASDLEIGNTIYSFFVQESMRQFASTNMDPSAIQMNIPTLQVTTNIPEAFRTPIDPTFDLSDIRLDKDYDSGTWGAYDVPSRTLYFKIDNFNPEFTYLSKLEGEDGSVGELNYDEDGNASITVSFDNVSFANFSSSTEVRIYNKDYSKNYVTVSVEAERGLANANFTYYCEKGTRSTKSDYATSYGDDKPYPIRDAMPCASRAKTVTSSLLRYPEDIANSMTMYMLGSAAEFRIYAKNGIHTGEKIEKVIITTLNGPCAGYCYYDLEGQSLEITGYDQETVTSDVSTCGYHVPATKGGEESVYMVLAPGTYDLEINIVTTDSDGVSWNNVFTTTGQTFTRANRKPFAVNIDSASAVRTQIVDETGNDEPENEL